MLQGKKPSPVNMGRQRSGRKLQEIANVNDEGDEARQELPRHRSALARRFAVKSFEKCQICAKGSSPPERSGAEVHGNVNVTGKSARKLKSRDEWMDR